MRKCMHISDPRLLSYEIILLKNSYKKTLALQTPNLKLQGAKENYEYTKDNLLLFWWLIVKKWHFVENLQNLWFICRRKRE